MQRIMVMLMVRGCFYCLYKEPRSSNKCFDFGIWFSCFVLMMAGKREGVGFRRWKNIGMVVRERGLKTFVLHCDFPTSI